MSVQDRINLLREVSGDLYASYGGEENIRRHFDFNAVAQKRKIVYEIIQRQGSDKEFEYAIGVLKSYYGPYLIPFHRSGPPPSSSNIVSRRSIVRVSAQSLKNGQYYST